MLCRIPLTITFIINVKCLKIKLYPKNTCILCENLHVMTSSDPVPVVSPPSGIRPVCQGRDG